ncbi:molybdate ABC transporter substrate-binding protein [Salidesulfovibrio onnuriiensis]|uniref:molybdate ABC transporter substrate-binding protein n=1 Tax=Salidesulfovibrio onnuriiensis TaxID=2583823 RepID=UPI0011C92894|nr:molybdate ABC transporter substrate-binding protein [Salidesulfovibrio onnuriiensis]
MKTSHPITAKASDRIKMITLCKHFFAAAILTVCLASPALAETITVACAANFTAPMKQLAALYSEKTGVEVQCTFGSTGMLYGQIKNGAPIDLFFAADEKRPAMLQEAGMAGEPKVYAKGKSVLWSKLDALKNLKDWKDVLKNGQVKSIAIATPKTAPYGAAAEKAMQDVGAYKNVADKLVFAKNVGQSFQFAFSGSADAAFVALSQGLSENGAMGTTWPMPEAGLISQAVCPLKDHAAEADKFLTFVLQAPEARDIVKKFGYE